MNSSLVNLNNRITTAVTAHLLNADALPPNTEVPALAKEITELVFSTLQSEGLSEKILEDLTTKKIRLATSQLI